jgi:lipopolysaccharide export system permease protein
LNLLHRYLFREVFFATTVAVAMFAFVMLGGSAIHDLVGRAASGQLTVQQAGEMILLLVPFVLTYALPVGLLTAVLLVLGRVSAQHEITAMRSAGLGLVRIGAPVLLIAMLGVGVSLVINYVYAPQSKGKYRELLFEVGQENPESLIIPGTFVRDFPGFVLFAERREDNILYDSWLWKLDKEHRVTEFAWIEQGKIQVDDDANTITLYSLGRLRGELRDSKDPENLSRLPRPAFGDSGRPVIVWEARLDDIFKRKVFERKVSWMDFGELIAEARRLHDSTDPKDRARLLDVRMNLHEKGSMAFSVLSFALVAVPLGIQTRRKETSANLGLALALTLVFYFGVIAVGWLDRRPDLHPELLLWGPNLLFQSLGAWMWWRFGRN